MPRNGSGSYSLVSGQPVVTGTVISSSVHNALAADIAAELTNSLDKDGQTVVTGDIDFNGLALILDPTGNTKMQAGTDNILVITINNAADFELRANILRALSGSVIETNTINETTSGSGVTIDGVLVKDGGVNGSLGATTPSTIAGTTLDITGAFTTGTAAWAIGTNQLVKNAAGNFGIGVTPAGWLASYTALDIAGGASLSAHIGTNADLSANIYVDVGGDWTAKTTAAGSLYRQNLGVHAWYNSASVTADTTVTLVNTMTLDASGNLTLNTARVGVGQSSIGFNGFTAQGLNLQTTYASTGSTYLGFYTSAGTVIGSISQSGAATTSFNTTSDPRLKSEFTEITGALDLIVEAHDNSYIGEFEFLSDAGNKVWGYNAHALIDNQAGLGGCEGRGPRNVELNHVDITPAGVDQSKRVPMLEAAIYDLLKMNEALTARLDAAGI